VTREHPAPRVLQAKWRAAGIWNDETLLDRLRAADGAHLALVDGERRVTLDELRRASARVAGALVARGVQPGDVICWQLPNWWEAVVLTWAIWRCGAIASPITPTLRAHEVGFILRQTGARVVAVPRIFRGTDYPGLLRDAGYDGDVIVVRDEPLPEAEPTADTAERVDDPVVVLWTSGTTADPKGVVHTHQSLRVEADTIAVAHDMRSSEALLLPMPVSHVAGLTYGVLLPVTSGVTAVLMDTWEPWRALELVETERIAVMISTPVFMRTMIDDPTFATTDTSSVRLFSLGGAGVAPSMVREGAMTFDCWCKRTYGSTEYPTLTTGREGDTLDNDATTDGVLIGAGEARIADNGELLARGPEMFVGYLDPMLDRDAFTDDGWFRTGDLARYDGEYLTIVDRLKDIIIRGGENISAQEVEAALVTHPDVAEAACVSVPDAMMGERVCAFVIPRDGAALDLGTLRDYLLDLGFARFKLPERLELRAVLPRTASGKIQKAPLREEVAGA
jgi:cyclohexanecarboxylate-CoA ligase